jgi:WD40 repeat protein/serine/threonine protein kinase
MATWDPRANEVFLKAAEFSFPEERRDYLDRACASDAALRAEVEALLDANARAGSFLESPALVEAADPSVAERPGAVIGPYKLLQQIGEGGMGSVFMAEQSQPVQRKVALKIIKPGMDSRQVIARFEAERQALALMDHPNIAKVLDAGKIGVRGQGSGVSQDDLPAFLLTPDPSPLAPAEGRPYFVMELVKGVPITRYCDEHRLTPRQRLELFVPVCQAVQHAHQKGIIHRDLKPSNVLVAEYDDKPVAKIIDFGVAKAMGPKLTDKTMFTEFGQIVGTLEYMSPEQAKLNALDIDTRSDIYALGVLLYELLTGTTPFDRKRLHAAAFDEMLRIIREEEPPKPSTRLSTTEELPSVAANRSLEPKKLSGLVRGDLDWIVMKALEKDRNRRYETANSLAMDLERYLADEPVQACPPSAGYRLRKFLRRNQGAMFAAALVLAALLIGLAASIWQAVRAMWAESRAVEERIDKEHALEREKDANNNLKNQKAAADFALVLQKKASYLRSIVLADRELTGNRVAIAMEILEECPPELRDWEWHYLIGLCHKDLLTVRGPVESINSLALNRDSTRLATVAVDGVRIWDSSSGKELRALGPAKWSGVFGRTIDKGIRSVAFLPDGRRVLAPWSTGCRVWDFTADERPVDLVPVGQPVALSPDGEHLAGTGARGGVEVWDLKAGKKEFDLRDVRKTVYSVVFSSDGNRLVTAGDDSVVRIWDARTGEKFHELKIADLKPGEEFLCRANFSPDQANVVVAASNGLVKIYDAQKGTHQRALSGHVGPVRRAVYSSNSKLIASAGQDRTVRLWEAATGNNLAVYRGHIAPVTDVAFSDDGQRLFSADAAGTVKVWDATSAPEYRGIRIRPAPSDRVLPGMRPVNFFDPRPCLAWSADSKRLVTDGSMASPASKPGDLIVWDVATARPAMTLQGHKNPMSKLAFSAAGRYLASASFDQTVVVWEAATGKKLYTLLKTTPREMIFSADSQRLLLTTQQTLAAYDAATGQEITRVPLPAWQNAAPVCSPDGRYVASADTASRTLKVWDAEAGAEVVSIESGPRVRSAVFSPDGQTLAAGDLDVAWPGVTDYDIRLWNSRTGKLLATLRGHAAAAAGLAWSPNGKRLASASRDGSLKIWDTASGRELLTLSAGSQPMAPAFSPDGNRLATLCADGVLRIWDATPRKASAVQGKATNDR